MQKHVWIRTERKSIVEHVRDIEAGSSSQLISGNTDGEKLICVQYCRFLKEGLECARYLFANGTSNGETFEIKP